MKKNATPDPLVPMAGLIRTWWIMHYRAWKTQVTGNPSSYGIGPLPRWDGGVDADGRRHKAAIWPKVAAHCLCHRLEPQRLLRAYFAGCGTGSHPVPTHLFGPRVRDLYECVDDDAVDRLTVALRQMQGSLKGVVAMCIANKIEDVERELLMALRSEARSFSPVFRYCMFSKKNDLAAAAQYADAALVQYAFDMDAYDRVWGDLIPERLRREALRLHRRSSGRGPETREA